MIVLWSCGGGGSTESDNRGAALRGLTVRVDSPLRQYTDTLLLHRALTGAIPSR